MRLREILHLPRPRRGIREERERASPKLKSKQKFRKFCFWVLDIEENKEGLDSAIRWAIV